MMSWTARGTIGRPQLLTYPDSLGGDLPAIRALLDGPLSGLFSGVHILPPFPSSADRGFAPVTYRQIDPRFGTWEDVAAIAADHDVLLDLMVNHISRKSEEFRDFAQHGRSSQWADLFITLDKVWPDGQPSAEDVARIFLRKPNHPFSTITIGDGGEHVPVCSATPCTKASSARHGAAGGVEPHRPDLDGDTPPYTDLCQQVDFGSRRLPVRLRCRHRLHPRRRRTVHPRGDGARLSRGRFHADRRAGWRKARSRSLVAAQSRICGPVAARLERVPRVAGHGPMPALITGTHPDAAKGDRAPRFRA